MVLLLPHHLHLIHEKCKWEVLLESCLHRLFNRWVMVAPGLTQDRCIGVHHMQHKLLKCKLCLQVLERVNHLCINTQLLLHTTSGLLDEQQDLQHHSHMQGHIQPWLSTQGLGEQMVVEELAHSPTHNHQLNPDLSSQSARTSHHSLNSTSREEIQPL